MVVATQRNKIAKGVSVFIRLLAIESGSTVVPCFDVANFTGDGASTFDDRKLASGKRAKVSRQSEELFDCLFGGFSHNKSFDAAFTFPNEGMPRPVQRFQAKYQ
jgi:hypothetical protein